MSKFSVTTGYEDFLGNEQYNTCTFEYVHVGVLYCCRRIACENMRTSSLS